MHFDSDDEYGLEILFAIKAAHRYNNWVVSNFKNSISGNVLEIGSGIGNLSSILINYSDTIMLSDIDAHYIDYLKTNFSSNSKVRGIFTMNIEGETNDSLKDQFNSIIMSNVLEHIDNDSKAINNCLEMLVGGGKLIVVVPAFNKLMNTLDINLGHKRRYNKKEILRLLPTKNYKIVESKYFNAMGIIAWKFGNLLKAKKTISESQMKIYNFLTPIIKIIDRLFLGRLGLSLVFIIQKK